MNDDIVDVTRQSNPPKPNNAPPSPESAQSNPMHADWATEYRNCVTWSNTWHQIESNQGWPIGYRVMDGKLIKDGVWCVPTALTGSILREHHRATGHTGGERLWREASRHFQFAVPEEAKALCLRIQQMCEVCQACEHPRQPLRLRVYPTPIPPHIMTSVSIDLLQMPEVEEDGDKFNVFACCVDRHSGWMVTTLHHTRGLTAQRVAKEMYGKWWSPHGIPSVITSDRGPHFAGAWWRAMCGLHGIRHAYAQAYHHEGNGRAEVAGAQLQNRLRKLQADTCVPWTQTIHRAVRHIHDAPGPSGLCPYEICTAGRGPLKGSHMWHQGRCPMQRHSSSTRSPSTRQWHAP